MLGSSLQGLPVSVHSAWNTLTSMQNCSHAARYICDVLFFLHKVMTTTASLPAQSFAGKPPLYPSFPNPSFLAPFSSYPAMPNTYAYGGGGCNSTTSGLPHLSTSTTALSALHPTANFNYADMNSHATTNGLISPVGVFLNILLHRVCHNSTGTISDKIHESTHQTYELMYICCMIASFFIVLSFFF